MFEEGSPQDETFEFTQCPHCGNAVPIVKNMERVCPFCHKSLTLKPSPPSFRRIVAYAVVILGSLAVVGISLPLIKALFSM